MTKQQVMALLGTPSIADPFHHERWDYIASERRGHGDTEIKNLTLWFEGDTLARMEGEIFPGAGRGASAGNARVRLLQHCPRTRRRATELVRDSPALPGNRSALLRGGLDSAGAALLLGIGQQRPQ